MYNIKESIQAYNENFFAIDAVYQRLAKYHGVTMSALFVLHVVYEERENCTQRMICEKLDFPKQTVNTILDSFEKKGYLYRTVSQSDKRAKHIVLTESGVLYAQRISADLDFLEENAFLQMTAEQREWFIRGESAFLLQLSKTMDMLEQRQDPRK